ncbi:glycoside hydrolase family 113 [Clostridium thailandense]|uniref:glycoside hydrolase family 113 n=1 Tax=Clostridium thailandense TaxID=2794346 RepID=UPI003988D8C2
MKNKILSVVIFTTLLLAETNVQAASFIDNQTVDSNKVWTIKFNSEVIFDDLTKESILVSDSKGNKVNSGVQIGDNSKEIKVTAPEGGYFPGEKYTLNLGKNIHSKEGNKLQNESQIHFSIQSRSSNKFLDTKIKSGNLSTDYNIDQVLKDIDKFQLNTLNIPVTIKIEDLTSSNMTVDKESEERAISLIKELKGKNINIILEPYPWIANGSESETKWKPDNINTFFWNWKTNVLKELIDKILVPYNIDVLNIGSSFTNMEYAEGYWCDTIDYVRSYYNGLVTYRTSWWYKNEDYQSKLNNKMFSKLDFISIAAYFELTDKQSNIDTYTVEELVKSIESTESYTRKQNVKKQIEKLHEAWGKPIFFGELGFPKINKASAEPWNPNQDDILNEVEQANCFEAYKKEFENESWLLGISIFAIGENSSDKRYYPSEQSASIIKNWYSK